MSELANEITDEQVAELGAMDDELEAPEPGADQLVDDANAKTDVEAEEADEADPAEGAEEVAAEEADPEDGEFVEWGEGEDAQRVKLDDLIAAYTNPPEAAVDTAPAVQAKLVEMNTLSERFTEAKTAELREIVGTRQTVMQRIEQVFATIPQPQMPDPMLATQDPMAYNKQLAEAQALQQQRATLAQEYQAQEQAREAEVAQIAQVEAAREQAEQAREVQALRAAWPDIAKPETRAAVTALATDYGLSAAELAEVTDHRFFLMARDLLAFREAKASAGEAKQKLAAKGAPRRVKARKGGKAEMGAVARLKSKTAQGKAVSDAEAIDALIEAMG